MSTVLSTPGQVTIPPSHLDIGVGGHFEGCGGCKGLIDFSSRQKQFFGVLAAICVVLTHDI